ncbi:MAG: hypothetical protein M1812_001866 [Candelaria pacifica]|nr:MAG: hypothetical protein M1812_001866 [Candelaria pacifica]
MLNDYKPTHDPNVDTFKVQYLLGGSAALAILFPYRYNFTEILWAFSIWLEAVAILPQLFMLQRTGEAETITTHYLFALGAYRALYIPNWLYRYFAEGHWDPIAVFAGILQTILYSDFFWIYYTKVLKGKKFALPHWLHGRADGFHKRTLDYGFSPSLCCSISDSLSLNGAIDFRAILGEREFSVNNRKASSFR